MSRLFTSGWRNYWSFSFSLSNEYSGFISFRIHWLDLLAVQGTLKRLLQHHSSKASILRRSAFFMVQISHSYMTTGKIYFCCSVTQSCLTLCDAMDCSTPGFPVLHYQLKLELVMPSKHLVLCCPLILLPSIFPSIRYFPMSRLFPSGGQSTGASASVLPMNIQDSFPL